MDVLESAISLKSCLRDTQVKRMDVLADSKVMILQEVNEPYLNMAVSKAATLLGAYDVNITDHLVWEHDYMGRVFSSMADAIFVSTMTHMCAIRFARQSAVPVLCMRSRTHASIQALATIMAVIGVLKYGRRHLCINDDADVRHTVHSRTHASLQALASIMAVIEEFGKLDGLNFVYFGSPHPVLNSYLLLCPMLGVNIRFKCCCEKCPVSPLLFKASEEIVAKNHTGLKQCSTRNDALKDANIIVAGPSSTKKIEEFKLSIKDIESNTKNPWIFLHTGPRGSEVDDSLFQHQNSRTFIAFENFQYIAAAMMAYVMKDYKF